MMQMCNNTEHSHIKMWLMKSFNNYEDKNNSYNNEYNGNNN